MAAITRIYASREHAQMAISRLLLAGFSEDLIEMTEYPPHLGHWSVTVRAPFGTGQAATTILEANHPVAALDIPERSAELELISRLSAWKSPGAISRLSAYKSPGAISRLSAWKSPGAISRLSAYKSPGAISRLSAYKSPGAISRLSAWKSPGAISRLSSPKPIGAIGRLSDGWYFSNLLGLPLLSESADTPSSRTVSPARENPVSREY